MALYDVTRGVWKVSERRDRAELALAVFQGVVREVYRIRSWHPAGTTVYKSGRKADAKWKGRWEFIGTKADEETRSAYVNRSVASYSVKGHRHPVVYVGC